MVDNPASHQNRRSEVNISSEFISCHQTVSFSTIWPISSANLMRSVEQQQQKAREWAVAQGMSMKYTGDLVKRQQQKARDWAAVSHGIPIESTMDLVKRQQQKAREWAVAQRMSINMPETLSSANKFLTGRRSNLRHRMAGGSGVLQCMFECGWYAVAVCLVGLVFAIICLHPATNYKKF